MDIFPSPQPVQVFGLGSWAAPLLLGILIGLQVLVAPNPEPGVAM